MSYNKNVYYNPEKFGLTTIGEISWHEPDYDFNLTVAWHDAKGKLYWASDSGCSCPSPFEDFNSLEDLQTGTKFQLLAELDTQLEEIRARENSWYNNVDYVEPQVVELAGKLIKL